MRRFTRRGQNGVELIGHFAEPRLAVGLLYNAPDLLAQTLDVLKEIENFRAELLISFCWHL
jgi:hypothetical protein